MRCVSHHEQIVSAVSLDPLGAALLSLVEAIGPSLDDAESACVVTLSSVVRHASTCIFVDGAVCATYCEEVAPPRHVHTETAIAHLTSNTEA